MNHGELNGLLSDRLKSLFYFLQRRELNVNENCSTTGSGSSSGYRVSYDGTLQRLNSSGINGATGAGGKPIDLALSRNSRLPISLNSGTGSLSGFVPL